MRTIRFGGFFRCPDVFRVPRVFDVRPEVVLQIALGCIQGKHVVTAPIFYRQWDASPGALHIRGHCPVAQINRVGQRPMAVNSFRLPSTACWPRKSTELAANAFTRCGECPGVSSRERRGTLSIDGDHGASVPVGPVRGKARQYLAWLCWTDRVELAGKGIVARTTVSAKNTFCVWRRQRNQT